MPPLRKAPNGTSLINRARTGFRRLVPVSFRRVSFRSGDRLQARLEDLDDEVEVLFGRGERQVMTRYSALFGSGLSLFSASKAVNVARPIRSCLR